MTLRIRTLLVVSLTLVLLVGAAYAVSSTILLQGFARLEDASVREQVRIALSSVDSIFEELDNTVRDWAAWDAARQFLTRQDPRFVRDNLTPQTLGDLRLNVLLLLDKQGEVAYGTGFDYVTRKRGPYPPSLLAHFRAGSPLLRFGSPDYRAQGIVMLPEGPLALVVRPFHPVNKAWQSEGTLAFGRFLDERELASLQAENNLPIVLEAPHSIPANPVLDLDSDPPPRLITEVKPLSPRVIQGSTLLYDLYESPVGRLTLNLPRPIYWQGQTSLRLLLIWLVGSGVTLAGVTLLLLERTVLARLAALSREVSGIGERGDLTLRLPGQGKDELGSLALAMNETLEALQQSHERQHEAHARYRAVVEQASEGILLVDPDDGKILEANPAAGELLGGPEADLRGVALQQFLRDDPESRSPLPELLGRESALADLRMQRSGGLVAEVEARLNRISLNRREVVCVMLRDVTEHRNLEAQLRQAQKMEAVGRLAGGIAHDFNNMLAIISGQSQLLLHGPELAPDVRSGLEEIKYAGERSGELTRQLLAYSRKQMLAPQLLSLQEVVRAIYPLLRRVVGEDVELVQELEAPAGTVRADPGQMEQVVMNLVVNARDAMPTGGRLVLSIGEVTLDEARVVGAETVLPGTYVRLTVSDTGTGMDAATQARLFEPFFTTKELGKGTGLGMATVYGIVRQSDGFIEIDSTLGAGTSFHIYLPRVGQ